MNKLLKGCVFLFFAVILTGCDAFEHVKSYQLDRISFSLPKVWQVVDTTQDELSLTRGLATLSMDTYQKSELKGISAEELWEQNIEETMKEMDNFSILEEYPIEARADRKIYAKLYTASKDSKEQQYYFAMVEFLKTDTYVYVVYETRPSYMKYHIDDVRRILLRMKWIGDAI